MPFKKKKIQNFLSSVNSKSLSFPTVSYKTINSEKEWFRHHWNHDVTKKRHAPWTLPLSSTGATLAALPGSQFQDHWLQKPAAAPLGSLFPRCNGP